MCVCVYMNHSVCVCVCEQEGESYEGGSKTTNTYNNHVLVSTRHYIPVTDSWVGGGDKEGSLPDKN